MITTCDRMEADAKGYPQTELSLEQTVVASRNNFSIKLLVCCASLAGFAQTRFKTTSRNVAASAAFQLLKGVRAESGLCK